MLLAYIELGTPYDMQKVHYSDIYIKWPGQTRALLGEYDHLFRTFRCTFTGVPAYAISDMMSQCEKVSVRFEAEREKLKHEK